MAINVPMPQLPLSGLNQAIATGGNLFSQMMNPVIQRENMARQWKQHLDSLALQKEQMAHARRNDDLQRQILQQQLEHLQHTNDPMYEFNQFKNLMSMMGGGQMPQQTMPTQETGEGMGMFTPEGLQAAQQGTAPASNDTGMMMNFESLKQNPMLRGFFKKKFGFDPLAPSSQTQEEKDAAALNLFKKKEDIKAANKSGETATNKVLTQSQQAVQAIDTVIPMIDEFINNPSLVYGATDISPSKKAAYNAKTGGMIDMLVAAQSLPQVKESVNLVEQQIRRGTGESTDAYIKRLKDFKKDLLSRRVKASSVVNSKKVNAAPIQDFTSMSDDELRKIAGGG